MEITTSMAVCSSTPTTFRSPPRTAASCPLLDIDFNSRINTSHHSVSKPVISGLSLLLASSNLRHPSSCTIDPLELASVSTSFMRGSHPDPWEGLDTHTDPASMCSPNSLKMRERSPVSVLQGPVAYSIGKSTDRKSNDVLLLDQQIGSTTSTWSISSDTPGALQWREDVTNAMPEEHLGSFAEPPRAMDEPSSIKEQEMCEKILRDAQRRHEIFKDSFIVKAFLEAKKCHRDQYRATGDLYLVHCVETAMILADIGASKTVVAAGLLHDVIDDLNIESIDGLKYKELEENFGKPVADLVEGVSRISEFSKLAQVNDIASKSLEADRLHTMFLAMVDVQAVLIKLADRLHNMRTLGALPENKQVRIANETLRIFAALANRLGIWSWKAELEDLSFKYLKPQEYEMLAEKLAGGFRETTILNSIQKLEKTLHEEGVLYYDLCGRSKSLYGVYSKMTRKGTDLDEVHDVQGLRLIMVNEEDCYKALETVHRLWPQMSDECVKDYIMQPKPNGYQSLHTVVQGDDGFPLEVQIRTKDMHHQAEFGVAAHWRYKEANIEHSAYILQMVEWARWMLTWQSEIKETRSQLSSSSLKRNSCPFPHHRKDCPHVQLNRVPPRHKDDDPFFVIILEAEKMTVQELQAGSTVADLLHKKVMEDSFAATGGVGFYDELKPRVNHKVVDDIQQRLKMGDLVEMTPLISEDPLIEYRNRIKRMYVDSVSLETKKAMQLSPH